MKKRVLSIVVVAAAVFLLFAVVGCVLQEQPTETPPDGTYSIGDLTANLDTLQGPSARSLTVAGRSVFSLPGGEQLSTRDLSAYLNAIKTGFAGYVSSSTSGSPYLVRAVKLSWGGSNSGLMWVPFTWFRRAEFPIIAYQHGTQVYRPIAPSRFNVNPFAVFSSPDPMGALQNYVESIVGALMASAGYIVVMPDYQGFGDSTVTHPYVTKVLGEAVSGAVTAARKALARNLVRPNAKLFLTGYSEGGYATMVGSKALSGSVTATVACDGPYDLSGTMVAQMLSTTEAPKVPWYLLYTASGYNAAYPLELQLDSLIRSDVDPELGFAWIDAVALFDGTHTNPQIDAVVPAGTFPRIMLTESAIADLTQEPHGPIHTLLSENNGWYGWSPTSPVVLIHCPTDDVVPVANQTVAAEMLRTQTFPGLIQTATVPPVPFVDTLLGSVHVAAYPTAMLAAFTAIQTINKQAP